MTNADPAWIAYARAQIGKVTDGPTDVALATELAGIFPEWTDYLRNVHTDTAWCGLFVARCLAEAGIRAPFDPNVDTRSFLWAQSWKLFGAHVDRPQLGDVLVFARHVTFYVGEDADHYLCLGGNQSDAVTITSYRKSNCEAILRPPAAELPAVNSVAGDDAHVVFTTAPGVDEFHQYLPDLLEHEGGNDDNPADPGGRTSRGVLQSEYDVWRQSHPGLPSDVFNAPDATVEAIFHQKYWDVVQGDPLPPGIDYAVFDYAVNSGPVTAVKALQRALGDVDVDGEVGPLTLASAANADAPAIINAICDARLASYQTFATWPTFGKGWTRRIADVRKMALAHAAEAKAAPAPIPVPIPQPPKENPPMAEPASPPPVPAPAKPSLPSLPKLDPVILASGKEVAGVAVKAVLASPEFRAAIIKGLTAMTGGALVTSMPWLGVAAMVVLSILNATGFVGGDAGIGATPNGNIALALSQGVTALGGLGLVQRGVAAVRALAAKVGQ